MLYSPERRDDWHAVGALSSIPRLGARVVETRAGAIAVFRTADDRVFALDDRCPHRGGPLSQGIVHDRRVTCPLHDWTILLDAGCAEQPDEGCVTRYPVTVVDGTIYLAMERITGHPAERGERDR
ncbi:MAG: nitrite reductase small subunit NirD [Proteobacteria bacterium]|nr:nitrite reductase small subunit NirD [Pseudomonadota bacterium]